MTSAVCHLHVFVKEVEPSMAEGIETVQFLTCIGQTGEDRRQKPTLLSEPLGASMLVETIAHAATGAPTERACLRATAGSSSSRGARARSCCSVRGGAGSPADRDIGRAPLAAARLPHRCVHEQGEAS
jgi:hypothetical protein